MRTKVSLKYTNDVCRRTMFKAFCTTKFGEPKQKQGNNNNELTRTLILNSLLTTVTTMSHNTAQLSLLFYGSCAADNFLYSASCIMLKL